MPNCQHVEIKPGVWVCPVCSHPAITNAPPLRECGPSRVLPLNNSSPQKPSSVALTPRESEDQYRLSTPKCKYRGEVIRQNLICQACGAKGQEYDVYSCELHDECTLGNRGFEKGSNKKLQACITCPDMVPIHQLMDTRTDKPVKITMISAILHNPGGLERWLIALARQLPIVSNGLVTVESVIIRYPDQQDPEYTRELSRYTKVISHKNTIDTNSEIKNALFESDVVMISGTNYPEDVLTRYKSPVVWVSHGAGPYTEKLSREAHLTGRITHWVSVGHASVSAIVPEATHLVTSVENGAEVDRCAPVYGRDWQRNQWGIEKDQIVIGFVGRFMSDKNPLALAETIKHLPSNFVGIMIGSGREQEKVKSEVYRIAGDRIKVFSSVSHIGDVLAGLDYGFLASTSEGFCLSRTEMHLAGLPMFSTLTGELPRLQEDYGDLCVALPLNGTGKEMASIVLDAVANPAKVRTMVETAKKLSWQRYTSAAMAGRYVQYLRSIL